MVFQCVKVSEYRVFSGPYFPVFGPEKTAYLDTFYAVFEASSQIFDRIQNYSFVASCEISYRVKPN